MINEFLTHEKMEEVKKFAMQFRPLGAYTADEYEAHIHDALSMARRLQAEGRANAERVQAAKRKPLK